MSALIDIHQRDEELYNAYKKAFQQAGMTHRKAVHIAIHTQTSRYWVSPSYIYRDILARIRGYNAKADPSSRRKKPREQRYHLYDELFRIYKRLSSQRYFQGYSTYFLISFVVNRPAPQFYISYTRARNIIARKRKEAHKQYLQNMHLPHISQLPH